MSRRNSKTTSKRRTRTIKTTDKKVEMTLTAWRGRNEENIRTPIIRETQEEQWQEEITKN